MDDNRIKDILNTISGFYTYDDDMARRYIGLIQEAIEEIGVLMAQPTSMLDNAKNQTITELRTELANRMNEKSFFNAPVERRKSEFKISKALVVVAIGEVIANMQT